MANAHNQLAEGLLRALERSRRGDVAALPIAIPSLIAFRLNPMEIDYEGFTTALSELTIYGLENLQLERFSASEADLTVTMVFRVPALNVRADRYHLQGTVAIWPISDRGAFKADVRNLKATAVVRFGASGNNTVITQLDIDYSVGQVEAYLSGSWGIVNTAFNGKLLKLLTTDKHIVINNAKRVIAASVNEILRGFTPAHLIEVIRNI